MKNKKKLPLLLLALLTLSFGAYGTRAYLTDSVSTKGHISIDLGTLDLVAHDTSWVYKTVESSKVIRQVNTDLKVGEDKPVAGEGELLPVQQGNELLQENVSIKNARSGDSFTRKITFKNNGSLTQKLTFTVDPSFLNGFNPQGDKLESSAFTLSVTKNGTAVNVQSMDQDILASGDEITLEATLTIKDSITQDTLNKELAELDWTKNAINVTATQTNAR